jgi:hypothetical protein
VVARGGEVTVVELVAWQGQSGVRWLGKVSRV